MQPITLLAVSDIHAGSRQGLCPGDGVKLEGGDVYKPGPEGQKAWRCWLELRDTVADRCKVYGSRLAMLINGDLTDGRAHIMREQALIDLDPAVQVDIAIQCFAPMMGLRPEKIFVSRGTPSHVGPNAGLEAAVAKALGAEHHPKTKKRTGYKWDLSINGWRVMATHHPPSAGRLVRTRKSQAALASNEVANRYWERGHEAPNFAIFSHVHDPEDSGPVLPHRQGTRTIILGPWQRKTQYAEKVAALAFGEHHALLITLWPREEKRQPAVEHLVWAQDETIPEVKV